MSDQAAQIDQPTQGKVCNKCQTWRPLSGFHRNTRMADGRLGSCRQCQRRAVADCQKRRAAQMPSYLYDLSGADSKLASLEDCHRLFAEIGMSEPPSPSLVRRWVRLAGLPTIRIGQHRFVSMSAIRWWITESNKRA